MIALIPNINYTIINTSTLNQLPFDGDKYIYDFDSYCVSSTGVTTISICNLTPDTITIDSSSIIGDVDDFTFPESSVIEIYGYETYEIDVYFMPQTIGSFYCDWNGVSDSGQIYLEFRGHCVDSLINSSDVIDFGLVGLSNYVVINENFYNTTNRNIPISFVGGLTNFTVNEINILSPGNNYINFTFNPPLVLLMVNCFKSPELSSFA